jgi:Arc/MetJ family transcription regulator
MYQYGYIIHMKTTINIDEKLLLEAIKISKARTKTEAIEIGLKEIVAAHKRKELANLFGSQKNLCVPKRRRF